MGWIEIAWPMIGAVSLTLGLIYLLVWIRQPDQYGYLLFFLTAAAVAVFSVFELRMMETPDPRTYAALLRWAHLPIGVAFVGVVGFVLFYMRAGRLWLGAAACGLRACTLVANFTTGVNVNFLAVTAMQPVAVMGGPVIHLPVGIPNPWVIVAQLSNLLLACFVADASITLWTRGDATGQRRAAVVGGSMFLFIVVAAVLAVLLVNGLVRIPTAVSACFLGVVVAMAYELGWDVIAAARLAARLRVSEESLRESEQRLQLAAGAGELGLWEWDVDRDVIWMTPECRTLFGYGPDEPVGLSRFLHTVHPDDREAVGHAVQAALPRGGDDFEHNFRIVMPDGRVRWMRTRGRIERDGSGAAARMRGVSHDVTARRLAEERFRTLVDAAPSAMLMVDGRGVIVLANFRAESMFGYAREELLGRPVDALVPLRSRPEHAAHRDAYAREWKPRAMAVGRELFAIRKDGTELPVEVGLSPIQTFEGAFVLASVVDVTERKRSELEAARQRDEMAHLARVAMLGELSGSLAHELNQPLAAILSNAQAAQRFLSRDPPQVDRVTEILADIVKSDRRAGAVITRLRSLLRKEDSHHQPIDMNEVTQEVLALMRSDLLNRRVDVHAELAPHLPPVSGDRVQLQQVLLNLLINACDAMAGSTASRNVAVRSEMRPDGWVRVSVGDRGPGIPPEDLERIFEPFVTTKPQGLGLGLAVCRSIVRAHSGRLWAENVVGEGAILNMELPPLDPSANGP